jgi:predicted Na+-dependent transporter
LYVSFFPSRRHSTLTNASFRIFFLPVNSYTLLLPALLFSSSHAASGSFRGSGFGKEKDGEAHQETVDAVKLAIKSGFRHLDGACLSFSLSMPLFCIVFSFFFTFPRSLKLTLLFLYDRC